MRIAILYAFHIFSDHVQFFLNHGVIRNDKFDFYFIYNGTENLDQYFGDLNLIYRENKGFDFGAWSDQLFRPAKDSQELVKDKYDYYLFINSSVTGPFVPTYCDIPWPYIFIRLLNADTVLSGISINCSRWKYPTEVAAHVQSMLFCVEANTLRFLIEKEIFHPTKYLNITDLEQIVMIAEIRMSDEILKNGKNIACLMKIYQNVDFRSEIPIKLEDPWYKKAIFGHDLNPYEVVFAKNNRNLNPELLETYMKTHNEKKK